VECQIVRFDNALHEAHLSLRQQEILSILNKQAPPGVFEPEFARYMIETSPANPYTSSLESLLGVEKDLIERRSKIDQKLNEDEKLMTISVFPLLGTEPLLEPNNAETPVTNFDGAISGGPYSLAKDNIEARSERSADIKVPVFQDTNTKIGPSLHLSHILFGPGGCGLQATFQCTDLSEARILHDQLIVLGPIFLALTAATPIYQGILVDTDVRWNQTASAVDDRPENERGRVHSRWSTAPMYLRESSESMDRGLDTKTEALGRKEADFLQAYGMELVMANYFAHLHLRDPLYLSAKAGDQQEVTPEAVHKSICASVWSHVRLKIPERESPDQGWRVEFRPMEVQFTDFANAAFLIFLDLVRQTMAWLGPRLDLWMPLGQVRENMEKAHVHDAVLSENFWFPQRSVSGLQDQSNGCRNSAAEPPTLLSINEVINGCTGFPGLLPLIENFLDETKPEEHALRKALRPYLDFIRDRAVGAEETPARWMRKFVENHPSYGKDSVIQRDICYDMLTSIAKM